MRHLTRPSLRFLFALILAATIALVGCGEDDEESGPTCRSLCEDQTTLCQDDIGGNADECTESCEGESTEQSRQIARDCLDAADTCQAYFSCLQNQAGGGS